MDIVYLFLYELFSFYEKVPYTLDHSGFSSNFFFFFLVFDIFYWLLLVDSRTMWIKLTATKKAGKDSSTEIFLFLSKD